MRVIMKRHVSAALSVGRITAFTILPSPERSEMVSSRHRANRPTASCGDSSAKAPNRNASIGGKSRSGLRKRGRRRTTSRFIAALKKRCRRSYRRLKTSPPVSEGLRRVIPIRPAYVARACSICAPSTFCRKHRLKTRYPLRATHDGPRHLAVVHDSPKTAPSRSWFDRHPCARCTPRRGRRRLARESAPAPTGPPMVHSNRKPGTKTVRRRKEIHFTTGVSCLDKSCSSIRHEICRVSD